MNEFRIIQEIIESRHPGVGDFEDRRRNTEIAMSLMFLLNEEEKDEIFKKIKESIKFILDTIKDKNRKIRNKEHLLYIEREVGKIRRFSEAIKDNPYLEKDFHSLFYEVDRWLMRVNSREILKNKFESFSVERGQINKIIKTHNKTKIWKK